MSTLSQKEFNIIAKKLLSDGVIPHPQKCKKLGDARGYQGSISTYKRRFNVFQESGMSDSIKREAGRRYMRQLGITEDKFTLWQKVYRAVGKLFFKIK